MDKRLILSVAGSGKTSYLIDRIDKERRFLVVTYTINNAEHIRSCIIRKFGYVPKNVTVYTYFEFLMAVCYRPFWVDKIGARGIEWKMPDPETLRYRRTNRAFYISPQGYLYHNRIAYLCDRNVEKIARRIEKYYDCFYYDEAQDLGGHDFNLFMKLMRSNVEVLVVGDFFQHTFSTSQDGNINSTLYDDVERYKAIWSDSGIQVDTTTLIKSHRCSTTITDFVRGSIGIDIYSHRGEQGTIDFVSDPTLVAQLVADDSIPKLFYNDARKYGCHSINWGDSKGMDDFVDVCIVLNPTTLKLYEKGELNKMAPLSKNKFYVACTRARQNLYFIPQHLMSPYKIL